MLLIDEIDKADLEFPNDLLRELDEMRFSIIETSEEIQARHRPVVMITYRQLPAAGCARDSGGDPPGGGQILADLTASDDEDIAEAAHEVLTMAAALPDDDDDEDDELRH